jgi:hypothetical protein
MRTESANSLIESIYPAIDSTPPPPPEYFLNRMILAPRNIDKSTKKFWIAWQVIAVSTLVQTKLSVSQEQIHETMNQFQLNLFALSILPVFHQAN